MKTKPVGLASRSGDVGNLSAVRAVSMATTAGTVAIAAFAIIGSGMRLMAHHSFAAQYDGTKAIRVTGTLTKVEWTNPHIYFYVDVKEEGGQIVKWSCEAAAPGALSRRGFKKGDLKLGDMVIVDGYRAKDGSHLMDARRVTLPDGRIVSGATAGDGGPEPAQNR
jgi:Family of unknown function (DUF6152)